MNKKICFFNAGAKGMASFKNNGKIPKIISEENEVHLIVADKNLKPPNQNIKIENRDNNKKSMIKRVFRDTIFFLRFKNKKNISILMSNYYEAIYGPFMVVLAKIYKKKSVVRFAGNPLDAYKYKKTWFNKIITYLVEYKLALSIIKHADRIIVMSQDVKKGLVEKKGYNPKKIKIIMQPIDYSDFKLKSENKIHESNLKLSKTKKNVLFAGNLTKGKGIDTIIKLSKDKDITKKYIFILAGADRDNYSKKLNKCNNITPLGKISKKELINYYHSVDLFFFPSEFEGFPKVITEAYATGCPIVAKDIVNTNRLADYTFNIYAEAKKILLEKEFKRKKKIIWPEEFKPEVIKKSYLNLIKEI